MQQRFVIALNPLLADVVVSRIVFGDTFRIQPFVVAIVDFRDITNHMGQIGPIGIFTILVGLNAGTGKAELIDRKAGNLLFGQLLFQHDRLVTTGLLQRTAEGVNLVRRQINDWRQFPQRGVHIVDFIRRQRDGVPADVAHQRNTVAVINQPARRGDGDHLDVVLVGARLVVGMVAHL